MPNLTVEKADIIGFVLELAEFIGIREQKQGAVFPRRPVFVQQTKNGHKFLSSRRRILDPLQQAALMFFLLKQLETAKGTAHGAPRKKFLLSCMGKIRKTNHIVF